MKHVDEYRDAHVARAFAGQIARTATRPWTLMKVCGGPAHAGVRFGLDEVMPPCVTLVHGPGCPVCVAPVELVDAALALAARSEVILCSFGDALSVRGSRGDRFAVKADGGDVRILYSPMDALDVARENPAKEVVFFAVGLETAAPTTALAVHRAREEGVRNFSVLLSQALVPPALRAILDLPRNRVQGLLAAGHVSAVIGYEDYVSIARQYRVPIVVTGCEPVDILQGVYMCVKQLEDGRAEVDNQYVRSVRRAGNVEAQRLMQTVFRRIPRRWRGLGEIPGSGLGLTAAYRELDAESRFGLEVSAALDAADCQAGEILTGTRRPGECPSFGTRCTPSRPLGALMRSSQGACAAYHKYRGPSAVPQV